MQVDHAVQVVWSWNVEKRSVVLLLRLVLLVSLCFVSTLGHSQTPLTIDAGLLNETQVDEVWQDTLRAWKEGRRDAALNQASALAKARAEAGWPTLYTPSVQAEMLSRRCLLDKDLSCALEWAELAVALAPVSGRAYRHRAWSRYQADGAFGDILKDMRHSWRLDAESSTTLNIAITRVGWLVSRGSWAFIFVLTLCMALKLVRSLSLLWRKWTPWLTGRTQTIASFTVLLVPWVLGAPLFAGVIWIWLVSVLCERRLTQLVVVGACLVSGALLWVEPLHYRSVVDSTYSQRWAERLRLTPERRFDLPITDLSTSTFRLAWSGEREKALGILEEAARLGELNPNTWTLLGMLRADSRGLTSSIDAFEEAISLEPEALEARFNKQRSHFALAQHQDAMDSYNVLKSLAPELCASWSDSAFTRPPHGFVYPSIDLEASQAQLPTEGPIWRAEDLASGALQTFLGVSRSDGLRLSLAGVILALALIFLRRQLVASRSCADCGYMVEWSQLMWRPMLCARCLPYKLSGRQRTMWTWQHFKGVRRERLRLNFGRVLGLALPGFDHAWLGNPMVAVALMFPAAVSWVVLAGGLLWVNVPSAYMNAMTGVEFLPAAAVLATVYLVSSFLRLEREQ